MQEANKGAQIPDGFWRSHMFQLPGFNIDGVGSAAGLSAERNGQSIEIGINSETDRLRVVAVWGEPSVEAAFMALLPPEISLFAGDMDVLEARAESTRFAELLENKGVEVIKVRDELAKILEPDLTLTRAAVLSQLMEKVDQIEREHPEMKQKTDDTVDRPSTRDLITFLLDQDIQQYGESQALVLIRELCLGVNLPMGNLIFARDQMNVLLGKRVISSMAKSIRRPEVDIYEKVYKRILGLHETITIPEGESFEGGDAYVHDGTVYVGVGVRTTHGAAVAIYKGLEEELKKQGMKFVIVEDPDPHSQEHKSQMDFMHLDTISMPIGKGQITACQQVAEQRHVYEVSSDPEGDAVIQHTGQNFIEHLESMGQEVTVISPEEQETFGCNFLNLGNGTILVPRDSNAAINKKLEAAGLTVIRVNLEAITDGWGAIHCMSGQLVRN